MGEEEPRSMAGGAAGRNFFPDLFILSSSRLISFSGNCMREIRDGERVTR